MILGQVEEAIARAREKIPGLKARTYLAEGKEVCWTGEAIAAKRYFPAWLIDEDNEYVQKALAGLKKAGIERRSLTSLSAQTAATSVARPGFPASATAPLWRAWPMCGMNTLKLSS